MKRTIALLIAALLLFSGCAKALPDAEPEPITPVETEQPTQAIPPINPEPLEEEPPSLINGEEQCMQMLEYLNEICDVADKSESRLLYAQYSLPEDWMINLDVPVELYQYPYNIDSIEPFVSDDNFMSNREVLSQYKEDIHTELSRLTQAIALFHANANGKSFDDDEYAQNALSAVCPMLLADNLAEYKQYDLEYSFQTQGAFVSDPSLIYRAVDGTLRVRGRLYMTPISGAPEAMEDIEPGKWYYADMEFFILPSQAVCDWFEIEQWTEDELTVVGYLYFHQYWLEVSGEQLAWLDENTPAKEEPEA